MEGNYRTCRRYKNVRPEPEKSYKIDGGVYRGKPSMGEDDLRRFDRARGYYGKKRDRDTDALPLGLMGFL